MGHVQPMDLWVYAFLPHMTTLPCLVMNNIVRWAYGCFSKCILPTSCHEHQIGAWECRSRVQIKVCKTEHGGKCSDAYFVCTHILKHALMQASTEIPRIVGIMWRNHVTAQKVLKTMVAGSVLKQEKVNSDFRLKCSPFTSHSMLPDYNMWPTTSIRLYVAKFEIVFYIA